MSVSSNPKTSAPGSCRLLVALLLCTIGSTAMADASIAAEHQRIREVETAILRGTVDALRLQHKEAARNRPRDVMLRVLVAWCDMPSDEAWNQLKGVSSINPENPWARFGMGRVYLQWKLGDQAEAELRLALKMHPRFYPAWIGLGDVARAGGDFVLAEERYRHALSMQQADPEAWAGLGLAMLGQGKREEARTWLTQSANAWPEQRTVLRALARMEHEDGALQRAAEWTAKLVELSPRDADARRELAELRLAAGQKPQAAEEFERALKLGTLGPDVYRKLASIYRELGDAEAERRTVEQLAALEPDDAAHPTRLSELAAARGDLEGAEAQLLEALERAEDEKPELHVRLARLRQEGGRLREALEAYREGGATEEATQLAALFRLAAKPAEGTVDRIYGEVAAGLNAFYRERATERPELHGELAVRVRVDDDGLVRSVSVTKDTVGDPLLAAHAYFALKDAVFPKQAREPVFEFVLKKGKR